MESNEWIEKAKILAVKFADNAPKHDREGSFPFENFEALKNGGFLGLTVPKIYGVY